MGFGQGSGKRRFVDVLKKWNIFPQAVWSGTQANFPDAVGLTAVAHDESLTGNGTPSSPLGVLLSDADTPIGSVVFSQTRPTNGRWANVNNNAGEFFADKNKVIYDFQSARNVGVDQLIASLSSQGGKLWINSAYNMLCKGDRLSDTSTVREGAYNYLYDIDNSNDYVLSSYANNGLNEIPYVFGNEIFLNACENGGAYGFLYSSDNGATWQFIATEVNANCSFAFDGTTYVRAHDNGQVFTATDPLGTWTERSFDSMTVCYDVKWIERLSLFVACGTHLETSADGETWNTESLSIVDYQLLQIIDDGTTLFTYESGLNTIYSSTDAVTWTPKTTPVSESSGQIAFNGQNIIIASGSNIIDYSTDGGDNWDTFDLNDATYHNDVFGFMGCQPFSACWHNNRFYLLDYNGYGYSCPDDDFFDWQGEVTYICLGYANGINSYAYDYTPCWIRYE
jgi:hypothetical protein